MTEWNTCLIQNQDFEGSTPSRATDMMCNRVTRWGSYRVVDQGPGFVVKRLEIKADKCISLQYHNYRTENWIVVGGSGLLKIGMTADSTLTKSLGPGSTVQINTNVVHQVKATTDLTIIEVWRGTASELKEEDIVRISMEWQD